MNYISVDKALKVAWIIVGTVCITGMGLMTIIMVMTGVNEWPFYIGFPAAILAIIVIIGGGFTIAGPRWVTWAYLNVNDVKELQRAWQLSGFGAYPVDKLKDEDVKRRIMERFENYRFEDDLSVPYQTEIYFKRPYRNASVMMGALFTALFLVAVFFFHKEPVFIVALVVTAAITGVSYYKSSDRSPQIVLTDAGIETGGMLYPWENIERCDVIQDDTSCLLFTSMGNQKLVHLDNLAISNRRLNHLLHVYDHRSKSKGRVGLVSPL